MDESLKKLGALVRQKRLERGLGLNACAKMLKISNGSLSRFERGERGLEKQTLLRLCDYFKIDLEIVYAWEVRREKEPITVTCDRCLARKRIFV